MTAASWLRLARRATHALDRALWRLELRLVLRERELARVPEPRTCVACARPAARELSGVALCGAHARTFAAAQEQRVSA